MENEDIERVVEEKARQLVARNNPSNVNEVIEAEIKNADSVKQTIVLLATKTALEQKETLLKVVEEKQEELRNDAEAKRIQAEAERIEKEVTKIRQEKEKQIAEYDKEIASRRKEIEQLKAEGDRAEAFFASNKEVLKHIGVREKKSLRTMQVLMFPATIIFVIVQILLFPITFCGLVLEAVIHIIGSICGAIKNNALKIIVTILILIIVAGVAFCIYYFGGKYLDEINIRR